MKKIKDFVVGRSEGVAYSNNNLTYSQFKSVKPILKDSNTQFIELMVKEIHDAKCDNDIKKILCQVYFTTQYDSKVRAEFDNCFGNI